MNYKFSIIIPHINEGYLLNIMLDSLYNYIEYENYEIIIVDDWSDNLEDLDFLKKHFLKDKIKIYFEKWLWSPGARNYWSEKSDWDFLLFLDSHMYFRDDFLSTTNELLSKYSEIDILQPTIWSIKDKRMEWNIYKIKDLKLYSTRDNIKNFEINNDIFETPNIAGWAMIIKKDVFVKLTWFNKYFIKWGCEDLEFSMRAILSWYNSFVSPKLFVAHYFKETFTNTIIKTEDVLNNRIMFTLTCFTWTRQSQILNTILDEFWKPLYEEIYNKIISDDLFFSWRNEQITKFIYNDEWYFNKFKDYYNWYFNL